MQFKKEREVLLLSRMQAALAPSPQDDSCFSHILTMEFHYYFDIPGSVVGRGCYSLRSDHCIRRGLPPSGSLPALPLSPPLPRLSPSRSRNTSQHQSVFTLETVVPFMDSSSLEYIGFDTASLKQDENHKFFRLLVHLFSTPPNTAIRDLFFTSLKEFSFPSEYHGLACS